MRKFAISFAILNITVAPVIIFVAGIGVGIRKTVIFSKYRELEVHGLVNEKAMGEYSGGRFAGDGGAVPLWLSEGEEDWVKLAYAMAAVCGTNSIVFLTIWTKSREALKPLELVSARKT